MALGIIFPFKHLQVKLQYKQGYNTTEVQSCDMTAKE